MLLFGRGAEVIDGIMVFPDHEDPLQKWVLSGPLRLTKRDDKTVFTLIEYNQNVRHQLDAGGYCMFEVDIGVPERTRQRILSRFPKGTRLATVPFDRGTVKCVALDVGEERILGAASPSLVEPNTAAFSLTLNENQTTILKEAFRQEGQPIGVFYELDYTAMRPTIDVELKADLSRLYQGLSVALGFEGVIPAGGYPFKLDVSLAAVFEKMVQDGVIQMKVITFVDDEDVKRQKDEAIRLFQDHLLREWFVPSLQLPSIMNDDDDDGGNSGGSGSGGGSDSSGSSGGNADSAGNSGGSDSGDDVGDTVEDVVDAIESASGMPTVKLKLKYIRSEELKTLTFRYNGAQATTKKYYPQGFFGRLLKDVREDEGIITVDANNRFFDTIDITVDAPRISYEKYGLAAVHYDAKYPGREIESRVFDLDQMEDQEIKFAVNPNLDLNYSRRIEYHFLPDAGWDGDRITYELPWAETDDRTPVLIPHEHIGFLDINTTLEPNFHWGRIQSVQVKLQYDSPTGEWRKDKALTFYPDSPTEQHWKLRLNQPTDNPLYRYRLHYTLNDGSTIVVPTMDEEPIETTIAGIAVPDLTRSKLNVDIVPLLDPAIDRRVYLDVFYRDPDNNYEWTTTVELIATDTATSSIQIPLMDTSKSEFAYRLTFIRTNNETVKQLVPNGKHRRIEVASAGASQLMVEIDPRDIDWETVRRVAIDLLYQDSESEVYDSQSFTFKESDQTVEWTVAIANTSRKDYQWRGTFYMKDPNAGNQGVIPYPEPAGTWATTSIPFLFLDQYQPKEDVLDVEFSAEDLDWDELKKVKVYVRYRDRSNGISERETVELTEDDDLFNWTVKLADPTKIEYRWKAKFYRNSGSVSTDWTDDTDDFIDLETVFDRVS
ncbi:MAG: hypothetical protein AAGD25_24505 [Cyanobacteria bacterium P01_F01_bin.150]